MAPDLNCLLSAFAGSIMGYLLLDAYRFYQRRYRR